ncbi:hypothetical protein [Polycladomyces subterraneus]|uniref:Uncharacterized protein n=1 Tax=Polycladomyces subterraneus TaxID=1016997 RepID=A0ABT8IP10_9BACL|nr:hypothetical protein [Polycladomyces subterraneus]MDN4594533.1 hypothetical protein [Polycladomyces subterraneus]
MQPKQKSYSRYKLPFSDHAERRAVGIQKQSIRLHTSTAIFVCTVVIASLTVTGMLITEEIAHQTQNHLAAKAMNIALIVARLEMVIEALEGKRDEAGIQQKKPSIKLGKHPQYGVQSITIVTHIKETNAIRGSKTN